MYFGEREPQWLIFDLFQKNIFLANQRSGFRHFWNSLGNNNNNNNTNNNNK